jgi:hypothetical protein
VAGNPRRKALFDVVSETCGLRRLDGGRTSPAKPVSNAEFPENRAITGNFLELASWRSLWSEETCRPQRFLPSFLLKIYSENLLGIQGTSLLRAGKSTKLVSFSECQWYRRACFLSPFSGQESLSINKF